MLKISMQEAGAAASIENDTPDQLSSRSSQPKPAKNTKSRKPSSSQSAERAKFQPLELVSTSASQPEVFTPPHMFGVDMCIVPDLLYRAFELAQAPLVNNGNCAPRHQPREPRKITVRHYSIHFSDLEHYDLLNHSAKLCSIDLPKHCLIIVHKLCLIYSIYAGIRRGAVFANRNVTASLRRAVRDLGLSSKSKTKTRLRSCRNDSD